MSMMMRTSVMCISCQISVLERTEIGNHIGHGTESIEFPQNLAGEDCLRIPNHHHKVQLSPGPCQI